MHKTYVLALVILLETGLFQLRAAENKPVWKWVSANEYYMILPTSQNLGISGGGSESVKPWGFGFRAMGQDTFSKTGGLQFQSVKVDNPHTGKDTFYLFDLLLGMEYMAPKVQGSSCALPPRPSRTWGCPIQRYMPRR